MDRPPDTAFPFPTALSLEGVIGFWHELSRDPSSPLQSQARTFVDRAEATPAIRGRIADEAVLEPHRELIEGLLSALFPLADEGALGGTGRPFGFTNIFETPAARRVGIFGEDAFRTGTRHTGALLLRGQMVAAYQEILRRIYGIDAGLDYPLLISVEDPDSGLHRHFQMSWDSRFVEVRHCDGCPVLADADLRRLLAEPTNLDLWTRILPPAAFEFVGLGTVRATDVTLRETVSRLKDDLLEQDAMTNPANVERWQERIRALLGSPDVQVGLIGFDTAADIDAMDVAFPVGRSLLLSKGRSPECPRRDASNYAAAFESREPVVVGDLEHGEVCTGFEYHLLESGFKSLLVQPLFLGDRLIGLLEVASPTAGELTALSSFKLGEVAQPFATALQRSTLEREDRIQSLIKRHYTAIHPSVEWRFRDAAAALLRGEEDASPQEIVFRDVYPLYGLTDIRGSSETRGRAIQLDLVDQLERAVAVTRAAAARPGFPVVQQLGYRIGRFLERIGAGLHSEDETAAVAFLTGEFEPLLDQVRGWGPEVAAAVDGYRAGLDPELGVLYRRRREFDESVARFNETISAVLNTQQEAAQAVFPHFFERFQTDGVDYNIYVGDTLVRTGGFTPMVLRNLRLWQLMVVGRIEWELTRVRPTLGIDLAPTHLVLVQDQPLAIRFRIDEKRFDVDGAYNIRYELVKKRIDKAHLRDTGERLTQPGKLAVVYSQTHEALEYRRHLEYLRAAGYYAGEIEDHELEDLQGVLGLRALRIDIAPEPPESLAARLPRTGVEASRVGGR